jgi:hypothetical protein
MMAGLLYGRDAFILVSRLSLIPIPVASFSIWGQRCGDVNSEMVHHLMDNHRGEAKSLGSKAGMTRQFPS